jgi:hypothetical protein
MGRNRHLDARVMQRIDLPYAASLPLPDARPALEKTCPGWPGWAFYLAAAGYPDWLRTYRLPPLKAKQALLDARPVYPIRWPAANFQDHATCPAKRPQYCDPYPPQAWHANPHRGCILR